MVVDPDRFQAILDRVSEHLAQANEDGTLHGALAALGLQGLLDPEDDIDLGEADTALSGDILVLGALDAKKEVLQTLAQAFGYSRNRFKFVDYGEANQFNCSVLVHSMRYAAVMCGPVPHKTTGMGDTSGILEELRHPERGYPPLAELRESSGAGSLRITKATFRDGLAKLAAMKAIKPDR